LPVRRRLQTTPFQLTAQGDQIRLPGTIPATLSDFKIEPPSLLSIAVKNEAPVRVDLTWRAMNAAQ
jgi:hypothetical protein